MVPISGALSCLVGYLFVQLAASSVFLVKMKGCFLVVTLLGSQIKVGGPSGRSMS